MKPDIKNNIYRYLYNILLIGYILFISLAIFISLLESFSYSGFFLKHFYISLDFIICISLVSGLIICVVPIVFIKSKWWVKLVKRFFLLSVNTFFVLLLVILVVNTIEYVNYPNFIYTYIHLQPKLLIKTGLLHFIFLYMNLWHIIRLGSYRGSFISRRSVQIFSVLSLIKFQLQFQKKYQIEASKIRDYILLAYSIILIVFTLINSVKFMDEFVKPDTVFLKESELKYARKEIDIYQWVEEFFPKMKEVISWCDQQDSQVELVTFDPEILWMNYEGLSRVFLTNCYIANIDSLNKTHSYVGKEKLLLVSVASCDPELAKEKSDPNGEHIDYFKIVNNQHICNSREIVPGLYLFDKEQIE